MRAQVARVRMFAGPNGSGKTGDKREHTWLAEITDGKQLELKSEVIPGWFKKAVLDPLAGSDVEL